MKSRNMDKQIEEYFQGKLDAQERLEFLRCMELDVERKQKFIEYKNTYALLSLADLDGDNKDNQRAYDSFMRRIRNNQIHHFIVNTLKYAAAVVLLVLSTFWFATTHKYSSLESNVINTLYVPAGQRVQLTLPDGTTVWLNAQTTLKYPALFLEGERRVTVEGEAFFDVAKDKKKPFIVSSQGIEMKVLGTKFNVYSYPSEKYIRTSLIEGALEVYFSRNEKERVFLHANEQVTVEGCKIEKSPIMHKDHFLWREGIYCFDKEPLINILKNLELYYDVCIKVKDLSIFEYEYTGKFRQRDGIDQILLMIQRIHKFAIEKDEEHNVIILTK